MKEKNRFLFFICLAGISLTLGMNACKSSKSAIQITLPEKNKNERLDLIIAQTIQYKTLASDINLAVKIGEKSKKKSIDGQLKIIKDQAIQISLKMPILGTEIFRITFTPDKLIVIDRINKLYLAESMKNIQEKAPFDFDFYSFQALLTNQLFIAGKNQICPEDYDVFLIQEDSYSVNIENTDSKNTNYYFTSDYTNRILNTQMYKTGGDTKMSWVYSDFKLADNKELFPMGMKMELNIPNNVVQMDLTFKTVNINSTFNLDYNYPAKYEQMNLQEVLKLIKKLL